MTLARTLDANVDMTISSNEIDNAPAALRTLDRNGDGKISPDELVPELDSPGNDQGQDQSGTGGQD